MAFHTTRWTLVTRAARPDEAGARALDELCTTYWPAVYAFYRSDGATPDAAADLTQGLFADLLTRGDLASADAERGRFRTFLRSCARNFRANELDRSRAEKRGGGTAPLSLDIEREESRIRLEPMEQLDPAAAFDRRWAQTVIEDALAELESAERGADRGEMFDRMRATLEGRAPEKPWAEVADEVGSTEGALKVAAHRLRHKYRECLVRGVRETLGDEVDVDEELAALLAALSGGS